MERDKRHGDAARPPSRRPASTGSEAPRSAVNANWRSGPAVGIVAGDDRREAQMKDAGTTR